jgi:hypothetical protein
MLVPSLPRNLGCWLLTAALLATRLIPPHPNAVACAPVSVNLHATLLVSSSMQLDELGSCKVVALEQPTLPPRSRLYSLRPIGIGTPEVESLTGYIARLAEEHCVSVYTLVSTELVVRIAHGVDQPHKIVKRKQPHARMATINGVTPLAASWVRVLESLTHRRDLRSLTMLAWANVLPCKGLLRYKRAWCPECLRGQATAYEPLLWCIKAAEACPRHRRMLNSRCPQCSETQRVPYRRTRLSNCSKCRRHLGDDSGSSASKNAVSDDQLWTANAVGEMLASSQDKPLPSGRLPEALRLLLHLGNENESVAATARRWGRSPVTVQAWLNGKRPQLGTLLDICRMFEVSPFQFLSLGLPTSQLNATATACAKSMRRRKWSSHRKIDLTELRLKLEAVLLSGGDTRLSLSEVSRRLGYHRDLFYRHFPELCRAISKAHHDWRAARGVRRKQALSEEVRRVAASLHEVGREPTLREVASRMTKPGSFRDPIARVALAQIRLELGPVPAWAVVDRSVENAEA